MQRWISSVVACLISLAALIGASGCIATRNWVRQQLEPMNARLGETEAKADRALAGLDHLQLDQKLVVGMKEGANFGFDSAGLSTRSKREIDRFLREMEERSGTAETSADRVFVVAGHTDSIGEADYNYELGQRRAERVAGYLVSEKGVDPLRVHVVSYGDTQPIADNKSVAGRRENRRVEILVYREKVTTARR